MKTYVLTVNSSNPYTGVPIDVTSAENNSTSKGTTSYSRTVDSGASFTLTAPALSGTKMFSSWSGCASAITVTCAVTLRADTTITANYAIPAMTTPTVTVAPSSSSITIRQGISVIVAVSGMTGGATPSGTVTLRCNSYFSAVTLLNSGRAQIDIPANTLSAGIDALIAVYSPDTVSAAIYSQASGTAPATVTVPAKTTPTVRVTPSSYNISTAQSMTAAVDVGATTGNATPTGTVTLTGGSYTSAPVALSYGSAIFYVPAGSLPEGSGTLVAGYVPDSSSASIYNAATGTSSTVTAVVPTVITVDRSSIGPAVTDQLMGMNMGYWYDPANPAIVPAFKTAGIKSIRWPGGSAANVYHWATNSLCFGQQTLPADDFDTYIADVIQPGNFALALAVNYATNAACTGPGGPAEAAAWVQKARNTGNYVSHVTVGNEDWGAWEPDLHTIQHDPATYANAVANQYYPQIKEANPNVLVGVAVNPYNPVPWDAIVLSKAKYDFVEFHFYPQGPGAESDTFLVQQAAQGLTDAIDLIKSELKDAGVPDTPIFVGEIGSVYLNPGKQTSSITQALYAGQALGEMMNGGVSRAAWWLVYRLNNRVY